MGKSYYFRVAAVNQAGMSVYSNIQGPVPVLSQVVVDNMENTGTLFKSKGITIETGNDRSYKEILFRAKGEAGAEIIYVTPGNFAEAKIYSFEQGGGSGLELSASTDGENFTGIVPVVESFTVGETMYDYATPRLYSCNAASNDVRYLKLLLVKPLRIARVELRYH